MFQFNFDMIAIDQVRDSVHHDNLLLWQNHGQTEVEYSIIFNNILLWQYHGQTEKYKEKIV